MATPEEHQLVEAIVKAAARQPPEALNAHLVDACGRDAQLLGRAVMALVEREARRSEPSPRNEQADDDDAGSALTLDSSRHDEPVGTDDSEPSVCGRSVAWYAAPGGVLDPGVLLADLEHEEPLPELRPGMERYRFLGLLGEGGMGKVYLAYDQDLKRRVAFKVGKKKDPGQSLRFLEEAQVMGQLNHPGIVPLLDIGLTDEGRLYYTMPVVGGKTLREILRAARQRKGQRRWSRVRLIQLLQQACQAVGYAHAKGVVHRDLKPGNVMVGEHGAVQVLDWGLSHVLATGQVKTDARESETKTGQVAGTPAFMAPEQASAAAVDARTDVWALGVMLYQVLTGTVPFVGSWPEIAAALLRDEVEPPRERAPERGIPEELERVCLRALARDPGERWSDAAELGAALGGWIEAEADRERRHELAEAEASSGDAQLAAYREAKVEAQRAASVAEEVKGRFEPWQPAEEKQAIPEAEQAAAAARAVVVERAAEALATLQGALAHEPENARARGLLADYYYERFEEAERRGDPDDSRFNERMVQAHDGRRYTEKLRGDGSLSLTSDPPGAEVWLHRQVEAGFVVVDGPAELLGTTPLGPLPLSQGSYVAVLKKEGYRDTRYPVFISRNKAWEGAVRLSTDAEIGEGFVHVPAGPFIQGGDPDCRDWDLPRSEPWLEDFFIAVHPVTNGEYLEYLNDLVAREGLESARAQSPRRVGPEPGTSYLLERDGRLELPAADAEGDAWLPEHPISAVSWLDAVSYCAWRSEREGRELRLPSESEWEKAARGVDGRWFPWGNRFDASLCNMGASRLEGEGLFVEVNAMTSRFPADVSPCGVRGTGGNVRDWTSSLGGAARDTRHTRVVRGGCWGGGRVLTRCADRTLYLPPAVTDEVGFRVVASARRTRR